MSFILDALKKAERERKLGNVPSIDATLDGLTASTRGSRWPTIIAAGLIANAAVLGALYVYWQQRSETPVVQAHSETEVESPASRATVAKPDTRKDPEPTVTAAVAVEAPEPSATKLPLTPTGPSPTPKPLPDQKPTTPPAGSEPHRTATNIERPLPPLLDDLPAEFRREVPALELSVHVYSDTPSQRFIFVNNRRYGEGQDTQEGARVERIQPNGIVLSYQGREFFLPGQW